MALNSTQIAEILFKKANGKATVQLGKFYGNNEEPFSGRSFVDLSQIWAQSNLIPKTAPTTSAGLDAVVNIIKKITGRRLTKIAGTSAYIDSTSPTGLELKNIIPFNYGVGYAYTLKDELGNEIAPGTAGNDWLLDTETGLLTFFRNDTTAESPVDMGTLPANTSSYVTIDCFQYIGKTAADTGLGGGVSATMGEWQNSVKNISNILPTSPVAGERYILTDTLSANMVSGDILGNLYNPQTDVVTTNVAITKHAIIEYRTNSENTPKSGWVVIPASNGMFTSLDDDQNSVYFFNGTAWKKYETEKTYPVEQVFNDVQDTFASDLLQVASKDTIGKSATPKTDFNVYVNGVKLKDNQFSFATIATSAENTATLVKYTHKLDNSNVVFRAKVVGGAILNDLSDAVGASPKKSDFDVTYHVHTSRAAGATPVLGDYLMVDTNALGYQLEKGATGDEVVINYVTPTEN